MSHITIIIERVAPAGPAGAEITEANGTTARVVWSPPDAISDAEIGQAVRRLYKQVRELGNA